MIGKTLKYLRKKNNYSQEDISKLLHIGRTTLSDYEREKTKPDFKTIEKIANICGYKIFFENENEKFQLKDLKRKDL